MTARHVTAISSTAVVAAVAAAVATSGWAETADTANTARERPRGAVEDCSTTPGWGRRDEFTTPQNLIVGPLAIERGAVMWEYGERERPGGEKLFVYVKGGHRVTLELSPQTRKNVGLGFVPPPQGIEWNLHNTRRVVRFIACQRGELSDPRFDGWPVTTWVGGLLVSSPRCVPLLVWVDDEPSPRRAVIRFGVRDCG